MRIIEINYLGRTANRAIQYMTARSLVEKSGLNVDIYTNNEIPEFNIPAKPININLDGYKLIKITDNNIPFDKLLYELINNNDICITINSYCQNIEYFKEFRDLLSQELIPNNLNFKYGFGSEYVVFHVRLAHVHFNASVHPWYVPLPFNYYDEIICSTGLTPVFIGEFSDDMYSIALKGRFSNAIFIESQDPNIIFSIFYNSANVGIALSTFSWLATFLSKNVKKVFFPILGLFDPLCYHQNSGLTNFLDFDDSRINYYKFDKFIWSGNYNEVLSLIKDNFSIKKLDNETLQELSTHKLNLLSNQK